MPNSWGRYAWLAIALSCTWSMRVYAQLLPSTDEFRVNATTTGSQISPRITDTPDGGFIVTWSDSFIDGEFFGVAARRFSSSAMPLGTDFQVNTYTPDEQERGVVEALPDGDFVVAWDSYYQDGSYSGIYAQRFGSNGTALGTEFQVNSNTIDYQISPKLAVIGDGFIIAWSDEIDNSNGWVTARIYDGDGVPQGTEFHVNQFTPSNKNVGSVVPLADGFLVTWSMGFDQDGDGSGVFARRFDQTGVPQGSEFVVNSYTTGGQGTPDARASADGSFVVVWGSYVTGAREIFGQRFDSNAAPVGTEFQVNTYTSGNQINPRVGVSPGGEFVVTWESANQDGNSSGVFARSYKSDGTPETGEFLVNQYTTGGQSRPSIAAIDERRVVIVWESNLQDGSFFGSYGRTFRRAGERISGKKLYIRESPSGPSGNTLTFVSKDASFEPPQTALEDPRCTPAGSGSVSSGARLRVTGAGGDFTIDLPCVNWSANADGTRYRYRDASGTTCNAIVLRAGRLVKANCRGTQVAYDLGAAQGDVHVTLSTGDPGTNRKYCATFGPQTSANVIRDGSDGRSYRAVQAGAGVCQ